MDYPEWIKKYKEKGTTVKKIGESYYLYRSTSERVAGKKYPVSHQTYIGRITEAGVEKAGMRFVPEETEGEILGNLVHDAADSLKEIVLIRGESGWMYTRISDEERNELRRLGLYECGFLPERKIR